MPYVTQSLLFLILSAKAKYSIVSNLPQSLWHTPDHHEKKSLIFNDWLNPHNVCALSFQVESKSLTPRNKLICSFYFVDPRWQLTTPLEIHINQLVSSASSPESLNNLLTFLPYTSSPEFVVWKFIKQNDPSIQHLIVNSIISSSPFTPPYASFSLLPIGVTCPITNLPSSRKDIFSLDPTSKTLFKGGHSLT